MILKTLAFLASAFLALAQLAPAAEVSAVFSSTTSVPVTAASYTATGNSVNLGLNFAPPTGTTLTVVNNMGLDFINGTFDNLAQGQKVELPYGGITYEFAANYYGGSGNDLVLFWANQRAFAWGNNSLGQLGDDTTTNRPVPVPVNAADGVSALFGKTVVTVAAGYTHTLALCSDGNVFAWGANSKGQLGDGTTTNRSVPVAVNTAAGVSALAGKTVVAVAAGNNHSLALCSDGTVAGWGDNYYGLLGDGSSYNTRSVPVAVNTTAGVSALAGKKVVAVAAGEKHSLALCSDGTVAAWGYDNSSGSLGDGAKTQRIVPVAVSTAAGVSALFGKTVVAVAAGGYHNLALCSDGTLAAWGSNTYGQVGDKASTNRAVPVAVNTAAGVSALSAKTVVAVAAGREHSLVLCSDGTLAAWGSNASGQLGDGSTTLYRSTPVAVSTDAGVSSLSGRTVLAVAAGEAQSLALCADGTVSAWGMLPVVVTTPSLGFGERFTGLMGGSKGTHALALAAVPYVPDLNLTGNGASIPAGSATPSLANHTNFGSTTVGGSPITRTFSIQNTGKLPLLLTGTPAVEIAGAHAADFTVTSQPVSPVAAGDSATFQITFSPSAPWTRTATARIASDDPDENPYEFAIQASCTSTLNASFATASEVPLTARGFTATGSTVNFTLNHVPATGSELMVVHNTGRAFISGAFDNLVQGQQVALSYGGITFDFVADYYGGNGNDLVLVWANQRPYAWGLNWYGELGNHALSYRPAPVAVDATPETSALADKTVVAVASGGTHNLALCSDGTLVAWGDNSQGQLGDGTTSSRSVPVVVNRDAGVSALFGRTVVAVAAGGSHSLALCSDGTVAAWGSNFSGQLGDNTTAGRLLPVAVNKAAGVSALATKMVVGVAAGSNHSLARCSDGTVAAWGNNSQGELGNGNGANRLVPTAIAASLANSGKIVVAVAAGFSHSLALCSDGTVAAWGDNSRGQLGINETFDFPYPALVNTAAGVSALAGKTVVRVAAGGEHSLALCSDGTVAAWGYNNTGQLGDATSMNRSAPVAVNTSTGGSALAGKTVIAVAAGDSHSLACCSDGTVAAWGFNSLGRLGNNSITSQFVPVEVNKVAGTSALSGKTVATVAAGGTHSLALCADGTVVSWGSNFNSQLGDNTTSYATAPEPVNSAAGISALAGKTVLAGMTGGFHTLARCLDGTVIAWGSNSHGQLGDGASTSRSAPVAVDNAVGTSALAGKTVVAVAAGTYHSLALCSDGTVAAWGYNSNGRLGDNSTTNRSVPVAVNMASGISALAGKSVVAVAAGGSHSLALCADGTVVAWGAGSAGQLGENTTGQRTVPVAVNTVAGISALSGKSVMAIAAGDSHSLALCSDGTVAAWGYNNYGQLGDATTTNHSLPVAVNTDNGVSALAGKTVVAIAAGSYHSLALCSDGALVTWGRNNYGQLGDGTTANRTVPTAVSIATDVSALAGKTVVTVSAGASHSLAFCSDGTAVGWGRNNLGQLGDGTAIDRTLPVVVDSAPLAFGERFTRLIGGSTSSHTLALAAVPLPALPTWRLAHFGSGIDSGDGADLNDFDQDCLPNLLEFAFGLDPKHNSAGQIPAPQWVGGDLVISFTQPAGASGISYGAEWSETLEPGSWTAVPDTGNPGASPPHHTFGVPVGTKAGVYLRLKVTRP